MPSVVARMRHVGGQTCQFHPLASSTASDFALIRSGLISGVASSDKSYGNPLSSCPKGRPPNEEAKYATRRARVLFKISQNFKIYTTYQVYVIIII
jgi:hypothetical protein